MNVVVRKKVAKTRKKRKPSVIHFCDLMCDGMEIKDDQRGETPVPICLADEKDEFILLCWDFWRCFISALRKELTRLLSAEEIKLVRGKMIFSLFFQNGSSSYLFLVHQKWMAQRLGIPERYHFTANSPTDAFKELRFLCFAVDKENPEAQDLQKILAFMRSLPLTVRLQLNLLASAQNPRPKQTAGLRDAKPIS